MWYDQPSVLGGHARLEEPDAVYLAVLEPIEGAAERPLPLVEQVAVARRVIMSVEDHPDAARLEGPEQAMLLEFIGVREAEHPAGVLVSGQYGQAAVTVAFFGDGGRLRGGERRFPGFPSPEADDTPQHSDQAEQDQKYKSLVHCDLGWMKLRYCCLNCQGVGTIKASKVCHISWHEGSETILSRVR